MHNKSVIVVCDDLVSAMAGCGAAVFSLINKGCKLHLLLTTDAGAHHEQLMQQFHQIFNAEKKENHQHQHQIYLFPENSSITHSNNPIHTSENSVTSIFLPHHFIASNHFFSDGIDFLYMAKYTQMQAFKVQLNPANFFPDVFYEINESMLTLKLNALNMLETEGNVIQAVRSDMSICGKLIGKHFAEAFQNIIAIYQ